MKIIDYRTKYLHVADKIAHAPATRTYTTDALQQVCEHAMVMLEQEVLELQQMKRSYKQKNLS